MSHRAARIFLVASSLLPALAPAPPTSSDLKAAPAPAPAIETSAAAVPSSRIRGVCFVAGEPLPGDPFVPLRALGAGWISLTPFAWQSHAATPSLRLVTSGRIYWGETDEGVRETARRARASGLKTLLNPHIWVLDHDAWRGNIAMSREEDWTTWFAQYRAMILHYAALARDEEIEALSVGTELGGTTQREADWRALIAEVRKIYPGVLTYAANWRQEPESIAFWDALDWIGVQAYYPVADAANPSKEKVARAWEDLAGSIEKLSKRFSRPVVFTEAGYRSQRGALVEPWVWHTTEPVDLGEQALGFDALFHAMWSRPWFGGLFVWKWYPDGHEAGGAGDGSFTPQGKPAEGVIRRWFLHDGAGS
jgi:hypothetical protein